MRLRKFNENKSEIDYDYVYECFAEIIDDGDVKIEQINYKKITIISSSKKIMVNSSLKSIKESTLYDYIEVKNSENILLQRVKLSLKRLGSKYPNYLLMFNVYDSSLFIKIYSEKEEENYPF